MRVFSLVVIEGEGVADRLCNAHVRLLLSILITIITTTIY
jgi:hypothetical protein